VYDTWLQFIIIGLFCISTGFALYYNAMINDNIHIKMHNHSATPFMRQGYAEELIGAHMHKTDSCWYESVHYAMYRQKDEIRLFCLNQLPILGE